MATSSKTKRILVLDDEPDVLTYLVTLLNDNGYKVLSARNGREGMEIIKREVPDLVTLDISMPERSGARFYQDLKADPALAGIPVIIVTAVPAEGGEPFVFEEVVGSGQRVPAPEACFTKPIDREEFLKKIRSILN